MVLRSALLLVLAVSQVLATSVLQLRSLEMRQDGCAVCTTVSNIITGCTTVDCICNLNVASELQACITCAISSSPTPDVIASAQKLIDAFDSACGGVPGLPAITMPPGTPTVSSTPSGSSGSVVPPITPSTIRTTPRPVTVTTPSSAVPPVQTTVSAVTTPTSAGGGASGVPPGSSGSGAGKGKQAGLVAIGAMVGAVLVL